MEHLLCATHIVRHRVGNGYPLAITAKMFQNSVALNVIYFFIARVSLC